MTAITNPKFRPEGTGYTLEMLPTGYTPVYYSFNCRPRQVKYYKVERTVENILKGCASRSVAERVLAKVKASKAGSDEHQALLKQKEKSAYDRMCTEQDEQIRRLLRKEYHSMANAHYNGTFKNEALAKAVADLTAYLSDAELGR